MEQINYRHVDWNLYRTKGTGEHYYHVAPLRHEDILVQRGIDVNRGIEIVNYYNREWKSKRNGFRKSNRKS